MRDDLNWLAGIIDGEGCFTFTGAYTNRPNQVRCRIEVTLTHEEGINEIVRIFKEISGCHITVHAHHRKEKNHKPAWHISTPSKLATLLICRAVEPLLRMKRLECRLMIKYLSTAVLSKRYMATDTDRTMIKLCQRLKHGDRDAETIVKDLLIEDEDIVRPIGRPIEATGN